MIARAQPQPLAAEADILHTLSGEASMQGDFTKAERLAREALALHRQISGEDFVGTAWGWEILAGALNRQKKFDEAERCYRKALEIFVKSHGFCQVNVLCELAGVLDRKGDQTSLDELRPLADAEEEKSDGYDWLKLDYRGSLRARLGEWQRAVVLFEKAIELAPDYAAGDRAEMDYELALIHLLVDDRAGYRETCASALKRALRADPDLGYYPALACVVVPEAGIDAGQLVDLTERAVKSSQIDPDYLTASGAALYRAGRWEESQRRLVVAVDAYDSFHGNIAGTVAYAHLFLALTSQRLKQPEQAQQWFDKAVEAMKTPMASNESKPAGFSWDKRFALHLLRQEVERVLKINEPDEISPSPPPTEKRSARSVNGTD